MKNVCCAFKVHKPWPIVFWCLMLGSAPLCCHWKWSLRHRIGCTGSKSELRWYGHWLVPSILDTLPTPYQGRELLHFDVLHRHVQNIRLFLRSHLGLQSSETWPTALTNAKYPNFVSSHFFHNLRCSSSAIECSDIPTSYSYLFLWVGQRSFPCTGFFAALASAHHRAVIPRNVVILRGAAGRCAAPIVTRFRIASGFRNQCVFFIGLGD